MQVDPRYDDLVGEIREHLCGRRSARSGWGWSAHGWSWTRASGFGKTAAHNLELIRRLPEFAVLELPLLVGPSRKSFIRRLVKPPEVKDIPADLPVVETGTQAAVAAAVIGGAHIVRVHDVASTVATVKVIDAILNS